jgi:hypothetical protein
MPQGRWDVRARDERKYRAVMEILLKVSGWAVGLLVVIMLLFAVEAGVGHDGLLCEWGYDKDGAGDRVSGCG